MERPLNRNDYRTLSLAALGGALEFYDFVIYVFLAPVIGRLFFPADMPDWLRLLQTFGIFSAGYLARPLGGILIAHFGDLLGRKRMYNVSYAIFGGLTPVVLTLWLRTNQMAPAHYVGGLAILGVLLAFAPRSDL